MLSFFNYLLGIPDINGLKYIPNFITEEEENYLIQIIDNQIWSNALKRKTQHYGYEYKYKKSEGVPKFLGNLPSWLNNLTTKIKDENLFMTIPNQAIVNEYNPGEGISSHVDNTIYFDKTIASLSLASEIEMELSNNTLIKKILLERRSLLLLTDEARYLWKHGIKARKKDGLILRERRISITFRNKI